MCWMSVKLEDTFRKTAEIDIEVYKIVSNATKDSCVSLITYYKYDTSIQPEIDLNVRPLLGCIEAGYHSYINIKYKKDELWNTIPLLVTGQVICPLKDQLDGYYVAKFIIPKGSKYYRNAFDEVVSSRIKYTGEYFELKNCR